MQRISSLFTNVLACQFRIFKVVCITVEYLIDFHQFERVFVSQSPHHAPFEIVLGTYIVADWHAFQASVDFKRKSWEILL